MRNTQLQQYAYAIACAIACKHVIKQTNSDWSILKGRYGDRGRQLHFALNIYVSYLSKEQKLEWESKGIKLAERKLPLLFDYLSYLRILPIPEIQHSIGL